MAVPENATGFLELLEDGESSCTMLVRGDRVLDIFGPPMPYEDPDWDCQEYSDAYTAWGKSLRGLVETLINSIDFERVSRVWHSIVEKNKAKLY
ncbi:hypothetical protein CYLTODRAFT_422368 [Cylindrobasidium torrendii FP15055 ss-10]|uniref:Uncharacterized protein n=1 Tax=Cylindrobasidium torrendii FP15055 ss-10 TaxID=1314674 RepID=A0A0D7BBU8_9AGAR|nr:hypothetical protein CYLTODRAFT_422368 [Cylindrobasidium torrendii FP15055 ss-10]